MRVLLVDDEIEFVSALAERLDLRGIPVRWAASAKEAMTLVEAGGFDIAVLDVKMPKIDGIELMHQIQAKCPHTQFIFLSGHGSEQTHRQVTVKYRHGRYLIKPIDINVLIKEMQEALK